MAALLGDAKLSYQIEFIEPGYRTMFNAFNQLPSPQQAIQEVSAGKWLSRSGRGKGDNTVEINSATLQ